MKPLNLLLVTASQHCWIHSITQYIDKQWKRFLADVAPGSLVYSVFKPIQTKILLYTDGQSCNQSESFPYKQINLHDTQITSLLLFSPSLHKAHPNNLSGPGSMAWLKTSFLILWLFSRLLSDITDRWLHWLYTRKSLFTWGPFVVTLTILYIYQPHH